MTDFYSDTTDVTNSFPHLVVYAEEGEQLLLLTESEFWTIGRGYNNSIVLHDRWVSRHHATIQIVGQSIVRNQVNQVNRANQAIDTTDRSTDRSTSTQSTTIGENSQPESAQMAGQSRFVSFYLVDLGSCNGSFVNGHYVTVPVTLKNGDRLTIGKTELIFYKPPQSTEPSDLLDPDLLDPPTVPAQHSNLTPSEEKVFRQVVQGFTNKEIGMRLQISPRTVQTHLSSIMAKLDLDNRSQIVRYAFEHGYHSSDAESP
ncbi:MAG: FHA domain-containing protein [Pseudanabaena sp. CRU_2_10]|nr:FHA domain-containing protein [Pseudanabaena sp. CRU_2_10]